MRAFAFFISCTVVFGLFALPALAIDISTSSGVTVTAIVDTGTTTGTTTSGTTTSGGTTTGGGGGGGGGTGGYSSPTSVTFKGRAYPLSRVILLKDGQESISTIAGPDAKFSLTISNLNPGTYTFSILSEDSNGIRSTLFTVPVSVTAGVSSTISGIFLAPTISIDKQEVKQGDDLTIFGQTVPGSVVTIAVHSAVAMYVTATPDVNGVYLYHLDTTPLEYGIHNTQSKAALVATNEVTPYGNTLSFTVGQSTVKSDSDCPLLRGDFNNDCKVNLIDFSIMAYWYKKNNFPPATDLNKDGKISFVDFSILAYYWTG